MNNLINRFLFEYFENVLSGKNAVIWSARWYWATMTGMIRQTRRYQRWWIPINYANSEDDYYNADNIDDNFDDDEDNDADDDTDNDDDDNDDVNNDDILSFYLLLTEH